MKRWQRFTTTQKRGKFGIAEAVFTVITLKRQFPDLNFKVGGKCPDTMFGGYYTYVLAYMQSGHPNQDGQRVSDYLQGQEWNKLLDEWTGQVREAYKESNKTEA